MPLLVQSIACSNAAGFVMSFKIRALNDDGTAAFLGDSDEYPIDQTRSIDLSGLGIAEGTWVTPQVYAVWGVGNEGDHYCVYAQNGETATYNVSGTTLSYSVNRV